jgi:hypothetical protein
MHSNPDSVLMLADIHHRELQDEAERSRYGRQACGSGFQSPGVALGVLHHLRKVLGRADEFLRDSKLARLDSRRGAEVG